MRGGFSSSKLARRSAPLLQHRLQHLKHELLLRLGQLADAPHARLSGPMGYPTTSEMLMKLSPSKVAVLLAIAALAIVGATWLYEEIKIDKCLDSGGAWNYEARTCKTARGLSPEDRILIQIGSPT